VIAFVVAVDVANVSPAEITVKTKAGRPKDRLVLPILIATLEERDKAKR